MAWNHMKLYGTLWTIEWIGKVWDGIELYGTVLNPLELYGIVWNNWWTVWNATEWYGKKWNGME